MGMAGDSGGAHLNLAAAPYLRQEVGDASYIKALLYYGCYGLTDSASRRLLGGAWDGLTEEDWKFYLSNYAEDPVAIPERAVLQPLPQRSVSRHACVLHRSS